MARTVGIVRSSGASDPAGHHNVTPAGIGIVCIFALAGWFGAKGIFASHIDFARRRCSFHICRVVNFGLRIAQTDG